MAEDKKGSKKPSSRLLGMKFMQRSVEKEMQEQLEKERKRVISEAEWVLDTKEIEIEKPKIQIEVQPSFLAFTQTTAAGRTSFNNFNKKIEALGETEEKEQRLKREEEVERTKQVADKEFGKSMQSIRSVSKRSSKGKEDRTSKKQKTKGFIKPT
ncbi:hypothetical protein K501DRAFT_214277 [Backusella circina FSU 941]|nr:hypothetical protein K501DRAFT_214277 [Backusella circina FSU 941]